MTKREDLEPLIIQEWLQRDKNARGENDVLGFHGYLQKEKPFLLELQSSSEKYQVLKSILRNHIIR
jgi:hypothetical protein